MNFENISKTISNYETELLHHSKKFEINNLDVFSHLNKLMEYFNNGEYEQILRHAVIQEMITIQKCNENLIQHIEMTLQQNVMHFLSTGNETDSLIGQLYVLILNVTCLHLFIQNNFVGPLTQSSFWSFMPSFEVETEKEALLNEEILAKLTTDGEPAYSLVRFPEFLYISEFLLTKCQSLLNGCQTLHLWLLRCLFQHQQILDDRSSTLNDLIKKEIDLVLKNDQLMTCEHLRFFHIRFYLEIALIFQYYFRHSLAKEYVENAQKISGLQVDLSAALGKRTRFQENAYPQLFLKVERHSENEYYQESEEWRKNLPKNLLLNDDTIFEKIQFSDFKDKKIILNSTEQAVILGICIMHQKNNPAKLNLVTEEMMPYVAYVLAYPLDWCIQTVALLTRSKIEQNGYRTLERSVTQMQVLVDQIRKDLPPVQERFACFYCCSIIPHWKLEKKLASLYVSLDIFAAALEIYERLQLWEEVISCYIKLGKKEKAESLIREHLARKETPRLWCLLGDITKDPKPYEKAWELSNHHSGRAQRSLGYLYLEKQQLHESISCFQKSLELNKMQINVWFSLGFAALKISNYELAIKAYHHYVILDPENGEGWNNLSVAYIKSNQKPKAFKILKESLKCNFENWKVWENFLLVAVDCREYEEAISASHYLMDIKDKYIDIELLQIIVDAVTQDTLDSHGQPAGYLRPKMLQLFGRLTSKITNNAHLWRLYAKLYAVNLQDHTPEENEKLLSFLKKAHAIATQKPYWEKSLSSCKEILEHAHHLAEAYIKYSQLCQDITKRSQALTSAKLALKGLLAKISQNQSDILSGHLHNELQPLYCSLSEKLEEITRLGNS